MFGSRNDSNDTMMQHHPRIGPQHEIRLQMNYSGTGLEDADDPAADGDHEDDFEPLPAISGLSLDDEIKRFEAAQRQLQQQQLLQQQQQQLLLQQQQPQQVVEQAPPVPPQPQPQQPETDALLRSPLYGSGSGVTFAEEALLYSSNRTPEEVQHVCWYNRTELGAFKHERKEVVKALKRSNFDLGAVEQTGLYCLRGYEPYFSLEVNKAMKYQRTLVLSMVLQEQERQRAQSSSDGVVGGYWYDDVAMEQTVSPASEWARENALQLGRNDELEAFEEYAEYFREDAAATTKNCGSGSCNNDDDFIDICEPALDGTAAAISTTTTTPSQQQQDEDFYLQQQDSLAYYSAHNDHLAITLPDTTTTTTTTPASSPSSPEDEIEEEQPRNASLLGKRKDVVEQPAFTSRPHVDEMPADEETDEIAERLDCALKLVAALKSYKSSS